MGMLQKLKKVPNLLTLLRIILTVITFYFVLTGQVLWFIILFAIAGLTDFLDGFIARQLKTADHFGAWFDSIADYFFYLSVFIWVWILMPRIITENIWIIGIAAVLLAIRCIIRLAIQKTITGAHLYSAKVCSLVFYLFVLYTFAVGYSRVFLWLLLIVWAVTLIEEIAACLSVMNSQKVKSRLAKKK